MEEELEKLSQEIAAGSREGKEKRTGCWISTTGFRNSMNGKGDTPTGAKSPES